MNLCQYIPNLPLNIHSRESKIMTQVDLRREWRTYNRKFYPSLEKFTQTCLRRLRHLETLKGSYMKVFCFIFFAFENMVLI